MIERLRSVSRSVCSLMRRIKSCFVIPNKPIRLRLRFYYFVNTRSGTLKPDRCWSSIKEFLGSFCRIVLDADAGERPTVARRRSGRYGTILENPHRITIYVPNLPYEVFGNISFSQGFHETLLGETKEFSCMCVKNKMIRSFNYPTQDNADE